jgi:hypothetical protein
MPGVQAMTAVSPGAENDSRTDTGRQDVNEIEEFR